MQVYDVPVAFFDLDDSLINKDANSLWIKWRFKHERWAMVEAMQALASLYRAYKKGKVTHSKLSRYYRTRTRGMNLDEYQQRVEQFFNDRGNLHIYPQAASLLFAYKCQGTELAMITGADDIVAKVYARELGINHVISNRLKEENGEVTGLQQPMCYGNGKVALARRFLTQLNLTLADAAFYSDSHSDIPLLASVAQPVVLNPNDELRKYALEHNWPCLDWRESDD